MNTSRLKVVAAAFGVGMAGAAWADLSVGYRETNGFDVPSGTVDADQVALGAEGRLLKTGPGTLSVRSGAIKSVADQKVSVLEGSVAITAADGDFTTAPAVCQKAAFWVDPTSVGTTNGVAPEGGTAPAYASRWFDVRETDRVNPKLTYAQPKWCTSSYHPADKMDVDPTVKTFEGKTGVFFGGRSSGQYMRFRCNGSETSFSLNVYHLFVVHAMTNSVGCPVGAETAGQARNGPFLTGLEYATPAFDSARVTFYGRGDICTAQASGAFFLDGERFDPRSTTIRRGWQLWECDYHGYLPSADNFYRCGFNEGSGQSQFYGGAQGGDYLGEVLVFTNLLTAAERASVERYLLDKWDLPRLRVARPRRKGVEYLMAEGASATVTAGANEITAPVSFSGKGQVTKDGAGILAMGPTTAEFAGDFSWAAGPIRLKGGRLPALTVSGGENYAFTGYQGSSSPTFDGDEESGLTCEKQSGSEGVVEMTGYSWLRAHTVADDVKKIKVGIPDYRYGAVLQLEGKTSAVTATPAAGGGLRATFVNPDMEMPITITQPSFTRHEISQGNTYNGWTARSGSTMIICTQTPRSDKTWSQWFSGCDLPPSGSNILQLVQKVETSTTVSVPKAGRYELSFLAQSRYGIGSPTTGTGVVEADRQPQTKIYAGKDWSSRQEVATFTTGLKKFERYRCCVDVAEAGDWVIGIGNVDNGTDCCLFLDDFRMDYIPDVEAEEVFKVPYGNFDELVRPASFTNLTPPIHTCYTVLNVPKGWTFTIEETAKYAPAITNGLIGAITSGTGITKGNVMRPYTQADCLSGGASLMFMSTGAVASTTFTLPAGRWHLRAKAERWQTYIVTRGYKDGVVKSLTDENMMGSGKIRVRIVRGGGTVLDLGTITAATQMMQTYVWGVPVSLDADEEVTLQLSQENASAMAVVDDLEFVKDGSGEANLLKDGDFDAAASGWTAYSPSDHSAFNYGYSGRAANDDLQPWYWGYCAYSGLRRLRLQNRRGVWQDVSVPEAGLYRFKMHVRARADGSYYANNPVRVWMAQGSVTNIVAETPTLYTRQWVEVSYLVNIPTAGTWRFGLEGRAHEYSPVTADLDAHIDGVSLVRCHDTVAAAPTLPEDLKIDLAKGATLLLDYTGKATCGAVRYNGTNYYGRISAATHPEFVTGLGELEAKPKGMSILVR